VLADPTANRAAPAPRPTRVVSLPVTAGAPLDPGPAVAQAAQQQQGSGGRC